MSKVKIYNYIERREYINIKSNRSMMSHIKYMLKISRVNLINASNFDLQAPTFTKDFKH